MMHSRGHSPEVRNPQPGDPAVPITVPRHRATRWLPVLVACLVALAGCTGPGGATKSSGGSSSPSPAAPAVTVTPADGAKDVAPATPIDVKVDDGALTKVSVASADGDVVDGTLQSGGKQWTSSGKLSFGATYKVTVTQDRAGGAKVVSTFSTVAKPGDGASVRTSSFLADGKSYGVGMPIILKLDNGLTDPAQRAAFEKSVTVTSTPATSGAWGWVNDKEVHFRPKTYWTKGSKISVKVDTAGRELGKGVWGRTDITVDVTIGTKREIKADGKTHVLKVYEDGVLVRTMKASLGKPSRPSSSGTMLVIDKRPEALFDSSTYGLAVDAPDGYRATVKLPMRLTWGGEFIHSAPWSVADQGVRNVSHGCINLAPDQAGWLYNRVLPGDPVTVTNTEAQLQQGNGWTDWNVDFAGWLKTSATGEVQTG
jgi:lipoprotein-anchoring transpeptidase ErfK/SrfK